MTDSTPSPLLQRFDRWLSVIIGLGLAAGFVWLLGYVADVVVPLAVGGLFAYLLNPLVVGLEQRVKSRPLAVALVLLTAAAVLSALLWWLVPLVSHEFQSMVKFLRHLVDADSPLRAKAAERLPPGFVAAVDAWLRDPEIQRYLRENDELRAAALGLLKRVVPGLLGLVTGALSMLGLLVQILLVVAYLVFMLIDYRRFASAWEDYLPPTYRGTIVDFLRAFQGAMGRYFRGQFVVASLVGCLFAIGFRTIDLKLGILFGLGVGVLNMVPYLQLASLPVAFLLALLTSVEHSTSIWGISGGVVVVYVVVQALQDVVITPRVMGEVTGLRPVVILFSVLFWGKILGFLGLLLAIPLTCLGVAYYERYLDHAEA